MSKKNIYAIKECAIKLDNEFKYSIYIIEFVFRSSFMIPSPLLNKHISKIPPTDSLFCFCI